MLPSDRVFVGTLSRRGRWGKQDGLMDLAQGTSNQCPALSLAYWVTSLICEQEEATVLSSSVKRSETHQLTSCTQQQRIIPITSKPHITSALELLFASSSKLEVVMVSDCYKKLFHEGQQGCSGWSMSTITAETSSMFAPPGIKQPLHDLLHHTRGKAYPDLFLKKCCAYFHFVQYGQGLKG